MKTEVRQSEKSTPETPLWCWRIWCNSREVAVGFCPTEEDARQRAERALAARQRRLGYEWWEQP